MEIKALFLGNNTVTRALRNVIKLFGVTECSPADQVDILIMVDGDKSKSDAFPEGIHDETQIIYIDWHDTTKTKYKHNFYFLTHIFPTYRIPFERFSIVELIRRIEDITSRRTPFSHLVERKVIYDAIKNIIKSPENTERFNRFLHNFNKYIEIELHNKNKLSQSQINNILELDYLLSIIKVPQKLELNILIVENNISDIQDKLEALKVKSNGGYFNNINFYLIGPGSDKNNSNFRKLKTFLNNGQNDKIDELIESSIPFFKNDRSFDLENIDLILQDIFLEEEGISGAELANLYFSLAPQAMVFFLTSMDIETLVAYGYDRKVDRIIGKDRIKGLIKYYYERFQELYGWLLWNVFIKAKERSTIKSITDKTSIRQLLANIRSWTLEPGILFHGYAVPEMVDHQFRHTLGLWNMANAILVPHYERKGLKLKDEEIMLLSLSIWLHDIGHRGDEFHSEPIDIRDNHASITESLILKNYEAFGLVWLKEFCVEKGCDAEAYRNKVGSCQNNGTICLIRKLGLLCRYHQSSAPLTKQRLSNLILKNKRPSPYCIVGMASFDNEIFSDYREQINQYLIKTEDFKWFGTLIRCLKDFKDNDLLHLAGLLRWLDALHTHHEKVGSLLQVRSQVAYLEMRTNFCNNRIKEIDCNLWKTEAGSEAYLGLLTERYSLESYKELLAFQDIHMWRSGMVRNIYGKWFWNDKYAKWDFGIYFELFKEPLFMTDDKMRKRIAKIPPDIKGNRIKDNATSFWIHHVFKEVIHSEEKSQKVVDLEGEDDILFAKYFWNKPSYWCQSADGEEDEINDG